MEFDRIVAYAREKQVDLVFVSPDDPLAGGLVDRLEEAGLRAFGPRKNAAILEGSKAFSKDLMKKYHIPTAGYRVFTQPEKALEYVKTAPLPVVVKASGLALGKGVLICQTREEAEAAVRSMMEERVFGESGSEVVIEEFLTGPEVSVLCFTDGRTILPMASSMDHKRALDGDKGLNTGGMGTIAPNPFYTPAIAAQCMEKIFRPTVAAMGLEGREFRGCLYFGLMLTPAGPKVIEYNCRFGDPETQVVLPLLKTDLLTIMQAVENDPVNLRQINNRIFAYEQRGDVNLARIWQNKLNHLLLVIASSGSGVDRDNAWIVVSPQHEYDFLNLKGIKATNHRFEPPYYDYIEVEHADKQHAGYFFEIKELLNQYFLKHPSELQNLQ